MSEFTWFQMLDNWYCWQGHDPVAILKENNDGFQWWCATKDVHGSGYKPFHNIESIKDHIESWYKEDYGVVPHYSQRTISRYHYNVWNGEPWEDTVCDVYYVDRLTGQTVLRYDAADPANTRADYGADSDYWKMQKRGLNLEERIPAVLGL